MWLQLIFDLLYRFWPVRVVFSYQQGVRFWRGADTALLRTGVYAFWPILGDIEVHTTAQDVEWIGAQSFTTKDKHSVTVDGKILYKIRNARLWFVNVTEFKTSLAGICEIHMMRAVRNLTLDELLAKQAEIEAELKEVLSAAAFKWGVEVLDYGITNLTVARAFRLFGGVPLG
jgi:regulator of protease activity HflC (stomatin/prohibitin superfamily)